MTVTPEMVAWAAVIALWLGSAIVYVSLAVNAR